MLFTFFFALFSIHTSASSVYYSSPTFYTESYSSLLYYSFSNTVTVPQQYPNPWFSQRMRFTVLNLSPESTYADPQGCYSTSSVVQLKIFKNNTFETVTYGCTADDILNSTKRDTLQSQLSTAVDHFSSLYGFGAKPLELSTTPAALNVCGLSGTPLSSGLLDGSDTVLFVTARKTVGGNYITVTPCQTDQFGRPTMLMLNIDPNKIDPNLDMTPFLKKAIARALGFSQYVIENGFIQWNSNSTPLNSNGTKVVYLVNTTTSQGNTTTTNFYLASPTLLKLVKNYFNCSSLIGAKLDFTGDYFLDGGIFHDELLSQNILNSSTPFASSTTSWFTTAVLQDTGFYSTYPTFSSPPASPSATITKTPDEFTTITSTFVPFALGCDFTSGICSAWPISDIDTGYLCPELTASSSSASVFCTYDLRGIGNCASPSAPCNIVSAAPEDFCSEKSSATARSYLGTKSVPTVACYETACTSANHLKVKIADVWYDCPTTNSTVAVPAVGFDGSLECSYSWVNKICGSTYPTPSGANLWPSIKAIIPNSGSPGSAIDIIGEGFLTLPANSAPATSPAGYPTPVVLFRNNKGALKKANNITITVDIPSDNTWTSADHFAGSVVVPIILTVGSGRSFVLQNGFTVKLSPFDGIWIWMTEKPGLAALAVIIFIVVVILLILPCVFCLPKLFRSSRKGLRRIAKDKLTVDSLSGGSVSTVDIAEVWERAKAVHAPLAFNANTRKSSMGQDWEASLGGEGGVGGGSEKSWRGSVRLSRIEEAEADAARERRRGDRDQRKEYERGGPGSPRPRDDDRDDGTGVGGNSWRSSMSISKVDLEGSMGISPRPYRDEPDHHSRPRRRQQKEESSEGSDDDSSHSGIWDVQHQVEDSSGDSKDSDDSAIRKKRDDPPEVFVVKPSAPKPISKPGTTKTDVTIEMGPVSKPKTTDIEKKPNDKEDEKKVEKTKREEEDKKKPASKPISTSQKNDQNKPKSD